MGSRHLDYHIAKYMGSCHLDYHIRKYGLPPSGLSFNKVLAPAIWIIIQQGKKKFVPVMQILWISKKSHTKTKKQMGSEC